MLPNIPRAGRGSSWRLGRVFVGLFLRCGQGDKPCCAFSGIRRGYGYLGNKEERENRSCAVHAPQLTRSVRSCGSRLITLTGMGPKEFISETHTVVNHEASFSREFVEVKVVDGWNGREPTHPEGGMQVFVPTVQQDNHPIEFEVSSDSALLGSATFGWDGEMFERSILNPYAGETGYAHLKVWSDVALRDGFSGTESFTIRMRDGFDSAGNADSVWDSEVRVDIEDAEEFVTEAVIFPKELYSFTMGEQNRTTSQTIVGNLDGTHHDPRLGLWYYIVEDSVDIDEICTDPGALWKCDELVHDKFVMYQGGVQGSYPLLTLIGARLDYDATDAQRVFEFDVIAVPQPLAHANFKDRLSRSTDEQERLLMGRTRVSVTLLNVLEPPRITCWKTGDPTAPLVPISVAISSASDTVVVTCEAKGEEESYVWQLIGAQRHFFELKEVQGEPTHREIHWADDIFTIDTSLDWLVGVNVGGKAGEEYRVRFTYDHGALTFSEDVYEVRVRERRGAQRTGVNSDRPVRILLDDFSVAYDLPISTEEASVSYRLVTGNKDVLVGFVRPHVTVNKNLLDFEEENVYEYELSLRQSEHSGVVEDTATLRVLVENLDEALVISGRGELDFVENSTDAVETFTGMDPDGNPVVWGLLGRDAAFFEISAAGVLSFLVAPDFETPLDQDGDNIYQITVYGNDGRYTRRAPTKVRVVNDDEAPGVDVDGVAVDENISVYFGVGIVSDEPFRTTRSLPIVELGGDDGALFQYERQVGGAEQLNLRFIVAPDHEAPADHDGDNVYDIIVRAVDGQLETSESVSVTVLDVVELPTFDQATCSVASRCIASVTEGADGDIRLITGDSNGGGVLIWTVVNQNNTGYVIQRDSSDRKLVFQSGVVPDYEDALLQPKYINVNVTIANDDGSATSYIQVKVQNAREAGSVELDNYAATPSDDVNATLTDPDGGIRGRSWAWEFTTSDVDTGWTSVSGETNSRYEVDVTDVGRRLRATVQYEDAAGGGQQTATSSATARVTNRSPVMNLSIIQADVEEHSSARTLVTQVVASDLDRGDSITYSSADIPSEFTLTSGNGQIRVASGAELDFEAGTLSFNLTVVATDSLGATASANVSISVTDKDEAPQIDAPPLVNVIENTVALNAGVKLSSEPSLKGGFPTTITLEGTDGALFSGQTSGVADLMLSFLTAPDHESPDDRNGDNRYQLLISASDGVFTTTWDMTVVVLDAVELPTIDQSTCTASVRCEVSVGEASTQTLHRLTADSNGGSDLSWSVANQNNSSFAVLRQSDGDIVFEDGAAPDYEDVDLSPKYIDLDITVTNDDGNDTLYLRVNILNTNESGAVTLDNYSPAASVMVNASLTDPDGNISHEMWTWEYTTSDQDTGWAAISGATTSSYAVTVADVGRRIRARVMYEDSANASNDLTSAPTSEIRNRAPEMDVSIVQKRVEEHTAAGDGDCGS